MRAFATGRRGFHIFPRTYPHTPTYHHARPSRDLGVSPEGADIDADLPKPRPPVLARRQRRPWLQPTSWVFAGGALIALAVLVLTAGVILQIRQREERDAFERLRSMDVLLAEQTAGAFKSVDLVLDRVADE